MRKQGKEQKNQSKGQSLVELAITFPILLMFLVGIIEVGWALHSYLVIVNANREGARFAARGQEFYENNENITDRIIAERVWASMAQQVEVTQTDDDPPELIEDEGNLTIFVHHLYIATEDPSIDVDNVFSINGASAESTCSAAAATAIAEGKQSFRLGAITNRHGVSQTSKLDLGAYCEVLKEKNNYFNEQKDALYTDINLPYGVDEVVVIETIYQHEMALKVPFFTAIIPDPIPMSINTQMRITGERSLDG
ncbi:MAG: hypothetical protein B6I34_00345 [Anaerolineaceae bacterium 4572_32.1]|nr:MAG: hypothetical protein B6I34_00345 [Anaerolineaceae bacterium 4572_32.1]